ncbi:MAG TPA: class I SAM-dependent methyltransferase, partial [Actinomycetes bacterium]|nr:class I SAM-dependent methyltransferase [Actinomycetes bacterium]
MPSGLPFRDASFDLVVTTVSFDHWTDQPAGLREAARVLRPGGRLVLVDLFAVGWLRPITALGRRRNRVRTIAELEAMLTQARLTPLAWERVYDLGPSPWSEPSSPANGFNRLQLAGSGDCRWPAATTGAGRDDRRPIQRDPPGVNESGNAPPTRESAAGWWGSADGPATHPSPAPIAGHPPMWLAGRVVAGRYRLRRPLGRGG